jgi:hypothetical protein
MSASEYQKNSAIDLVEARIMVAARHMGYPPTPDVGRRLRAALSSTKRSRRMGLWRAAPARWAAGLALLLLFAGSLLVPEVRAFWTAIFRLGSVTVHVATPTPLPQGLTPVPTPSPAWSLDLAGETTLAEARATLKYPLKVPSYTAALGQPDRVYVQNLDGQAAILAWTSDEVPETAEMVLFSLSSRQMARKYIEDSEMLVQTSVGQTWGLWIRGPHLVELERGSGRYGYELHDVRRLVGGNTLVWVDDSGITYRLETKQPLEEAVRIAESLK